MIRPKSPLLNKPKQALDALLETMGTADYQSLGGHGSDSGNQPYTSPIGGTGVNKGTEFESGNEVIIPANDFVARPPSGPEDATFFKEGDQEAHAHYEVRRASHGVPARVIAAFPAEVDSVLGKYGYRYVGRVTNGTELWGKGKGDQIVFNPATKSWAHKTDGAADLYGTLNDLEDQISIHHNFERPVMAATKPKCPHCGSTDYGLMPSDFETAKCNDCGKNWDHGIVPGINDPKTAAVVLPALNVEDLRAIGSGEMSVDEWKKKEPDTSTALSAALQGLKTAHGNVPDTGEYDFEHEAHVREEATGWSQYAEEQDNEEEIKPYDPAGNYLCGTCDMRRGTNDCARVEGPISFEKGSCRLYHLGPMEKDPPMKKKFSQEDAKYGENEGGFGCHRCEYGGEAKQPDPDGRKSWCSFWGMHIQPNACCAQWDKGAEGEVKQVDKKSFVTIEQLKTAAQKLYHVTHTEKVPSIKEKGIVQSFQSNWVKTEGHNRYGEGEIFAMNHPTDAVRWAGKMDWDFNKEMGTGKISIVVFKPGKEKWEVDTADPMSQAGSKGQWLKAHGRVPPENITAVVPVTQDMIRAVIQEKPVKLGSVVDDYERLYDSLKRWKETIPHTDEGKLAAMKPLRKYVEKLEALQSNPKDFLFEGVAPDFDNVTENLVKAKEWINKVERDLQGDDYEKQNGRWNFEAAFSYVWNAYHNLGVNFYHRNHDIRDSIRVGNTKSYGMGTPIGGTPNGGAFDDPEEDEEENAQMNMVASGDDISWWSKIARPTDQKIEMLQKQFKLLPEQIELCIAADPSPQQKDFVAWIAKWFTKKQISLPEDTEKLTKQLGLFQKLKKSPQFKGNKDVQTYDPATLFKTIEENANAVSKKEKKRQFVREGTSVIVDDGNLTIYKVTSVPALMELSGGTNWCTAHNSNSTHYLSMGPSYVFFKDDSAFAQLHPASDQLMNRQDVCMVEEMSDSAGKTIAKFVSDPTAMKGLRLLSAIEPNVAAWIKANATEPGTLAEILGRKMTEEQAQGEVNREMTVRHAMAVNKALPPEQEAKLPKQVGDVGLLFKYGEQFHAGAPWKPLEQAVLAEEGGGTVTQYVLAFLNGQRWKEGEKALLTAAWGKDNGGAMKAALEYAEKIVKNRWPELEAKFASSPVISGRSTMGSTFGWGAANYAIKILKKRWTEVVPPGADGVSHEEDLIKRNPKWLNQYSKQFMPQELWNQFRDTMLDRTMLDESEYQPDADLWVVREWRDLRSCVRDIGDNGADEAMDYALEDIDPEAAEDRDIPDVYEMAKEISSNVSIAALRRMGQSLQEEEPDLVNRWARDNHVEVDFSNAQHMDSLLIFIERYNPDCSVWKNIRKSYQNGKEAQYRSRRIGDLEYALTNDMYERGEDSNGRTIYTELRYGPEFKSNSGNNWNVAPVYEVLTREGAALMMEDAADEGTGRPLDLDISTGQLSFYMMDDDPSGRDEDNEESFELMDKWYTAGTPRLEDPNQMPLQFTGSLLKKNAIVQMHETPTMLPPRDDMRRHIDTQVQDETMEGVMDGVKQPTPAQKRPGQKQQIDPSVNPNGQSNYDPMMAHNPALMNPYLTNPALQMPMNAAIEGEVMPKRMGNWKLWVFPKDKVRYGQFGEIARPIPSDTQMYYVGDKKRALDILNESYGPLTRQQEDRILSHGALDLEDVVIRVTNVDYTKEIKLPPRKNKALEASKNAKLAPVTMPQFKQWMRTIPDFIRNLDVKRVPGALQLDYKGKALGYAGFPIDELKSMIPVDKLMALIPEPKDDPVWDSVVAPKWYSASKHADQVDESVLEQAEMENAEHEAYEVFLAQDYLQQEAQERRITMRELWEQVKNEFKAEYRQSPYRAERENKIGPEFKREASCPKCKKANTQELYDPHAKDAKLAECLACGAFFDF